MNSPIYNLRPQRRSGIPDVVFVLMIVNGVLYALERFKPEFMIYHFGLWPLDSGLFRPWQLLTYGFLHDLNELSCRCSRGLGATCDGIEHRVILLVSDSD